ncbi:hypothetical protein GDO86_011828 [Hymenochirus boettgeri]|uniref:Uncharacterized protein n=1 Tax=Hymenochirus boettgeri TaxID=247094 RepID=A0A8T2JKZ9_9PIPI|nr:hypothetical protein GDO86_011828 [Hymenochirus boettgeri]
MGGALDQTKYLCFKYFTFIVRVLVHALKKFIWYSLLNQELRLVIFWVYHSSPCFKPQLSVFHQLTKANCRNFSKTACWKSHTQGQTD